MKFKIRSLLKLYDERANDAGRGSDVSAISGLLGEDIVLGLFQHYWQHVEGGRAEVLSYSCTTGKIRGPRLDAWMLCKHNSQEILYQTEVKNWAAYSWGEEPLSLRATQAEVNQYGKEQWDYYFGGDNIQHDRVAKVLLPMRKPESHARLQAIPLCCFWFYITKQPGQPFARHLFPKSQSVHVFSASAYLRSLDCTEIEIDTPRYQRRLDLLKTLHS